MGSTKEDDRLRPRVADKPMQSTASGAPAFLDVETNRDIGHHVLYLRPGRRLDAASPPPSSITRLRLEHNSYMAASRRGPQATAEVHDQGATKAKPSRSGKSTAVGSLSRRTAGDGLSCGESAGSVTRLPAPKSSTISTNGIGIGGLPDQSAAQSTGTSSEVMFHRICGLADSHGHSRDRLVRGDWLDDQFVYTALKASISTPAAWYTLDSLPLELELAYTTQTPKAPGLFRHRNAIFPAFTGAHWVLDFVDRENAICTITTLSL